LRHYSISLTTRTSLDFKLKYLLLALVIEML